MWGRTACLSAMLLVAGSPCLPQFEFRSVTGVVTDKRGNPLPGAAVQLENTDSLSVTSYMTDKDGRYQFTRLNEAIDYTLKAKYRS
jgi:Carboxypeptidase regulatory-like domain